MPLREAASLRELLTLREANLGRLRACPGYLGSAVGFKYSEERKALTERAGAGLGVFIPAVILFVNRKEDPAGRTDLLDPMLSHDGVSCATDVVVGHPGQIEDAIAPLDAENLRLLRRLQTTGEGAFGGMPLQANGEIGAAACVVHPRGRPDDLGLLTAQHVAGDPGTVIERPTPRSAVLGFTARMVRDVSAASHLATAGFAAGSALATAAFRLDAAFVRLNPGVAATPGILATAVGSEPEPLEIEGFGLLAREVESVGPIRGRQRGRVVGFAYEWSPGARHQLTDWLIVGDNGGVFAEPGDSGKLIVDSRTRQPVALLWGGRPFVNRLSGHQQAWCYASHLSSVLDELGLVLAHTGHESSPPPGNDASPTSSAA